MRRLVLAVISCGACSSHELPRAAITLADARHTTDSTIADPSAIPVLAVGAPATSLTSSVPISVAGVQWRATVPIVTTGNESIPDRGPFVIHDEVFVSRRGEEIYVYALATGQLVRSGKLAHATLAATSDALVATNATGEFGVDPIRLVPTWHAPLADGLVTFDNLIEERSSASDRPTLRVRRAADGQVVFEVNEDAYLRARGAVIGHTVFLQTVLDIVASDTETGSIRWRRKGSLQSTSGGRLAIRAHSEPHATMLVDVDGHDLWRAPDADVVLHGNRAYAVTATELVAIDLPANTVAWRRRRPSVALFGADDTWIYGGSDSEIVLMSAQTGELATRLPLEPSDAVAPVIADGRAIALLGYQYLFAIGARAKAEVTGSREVRACLGVAGCRGPAAKLVGATVTLAGTTTTTDSRGCARVRISAGLAPVALDVHGGEFAGYQFDHIILDDPFPTSVIIDGSSLDVWGRWIGAGCHDSTPDSFP